MHLIFSSHLDIGSDQNDMLQKIDSPYQRSCLSLSLTNFELVLSLSLHPYLFSFPATKLASVAGYSVKFWSISLGDQTLVQKKSKN